MSKKLFWDEKGQSLVLVAVTLAALIGIGGLAIEGGRLYLAKSELQKAADAGALAAADAIVDEYLIPNKEFDSDKDTKIKGIAEAIANNNFAATYEPTADYVEGRKENYYQVEGNVNVQFFLMQILGFTSSEVKALSKVKITKPAYTDIIPIGIKYTPDQPGNIYDITFPPGEGETGNYGLLNFDIIKAPGTLNVKCNSGGSPTVAEYIRKGAPEPITENMIVCTETGDPINSNPILTELNKKDYVIVLIISGTGTGTSIRTVIGFAAFELETVDDKAHPKSNTVKGKFIRIVPLKEITDNVDYKIKIVK